jgi:MATE family, multidrug efflux pump
VIPHAFTSDPRVVERADRIWWMFAAMMPLNGAVFALDGILIGAGDTRFLMWAMLTAAALYVPVALLALNQGWGIVGVWCGLVGLILVRAVTCGARFAGSRWALTGAPA